jgi:hypothetical protein
MTHSGLEQLEEPVAVHPERVPRAFRSEGGRMAGLESELQGPAVRVHRGRVAEACYPAARTKVIDSESGLLETVHFRPEHVAAALSLAERDQRTALGSGSERMAVHMRPEHVAAALFLAETDQRAASGSGLQGMTARVHPQKPAESGPLKTVGSEHVAAALSLAVTDQRAPGSGTQGMAAHVHPQ